VITYKNDNSLFSVIRIKQCFVDYQIDKLDLTAAVDITNVGKYFDKSYYLLNHWFEMSSWQNEARFRLVKDKKLFQRFADVQEMEKLYPGVKYLTYVVNPYYRVLANYFVFYQNNKDTSFEDFVCGLVPQKNQLDWMESNNNSVVFIVKFEQMEQDFRPIMDYFEVNDARPFVFYDKVDYRPYYTKKSREVVESIFYKDCNGLGYSFDNVNYG
jgi:hypothetical protein